MNRWKEKTLSYAEKEVLVKVVAQAIPTYVMSVFKLPKKLCMKLERVIRDFWWGQQDGKRKMH